MKCVNPECGRPHNIVGKRGLCWTCYHTPEIRERTPRICRRAHDKEPTMEELDALVAKAMADPPPWWDAESRRMGNRAVMSQLGPTREQLGWLRAMISEFREGLDKHHDPLSALEAVRECTALAEALDRMLPPDPVQAVPLFTPDMLAEIPY